MTPSERAKKIADRFFNCPVDDPEYPLIEQFAPPNVMERVKALLTADIEEAIEDAVEVERDLSSDPASERY